MNIYYDPEKFGLRVVKSADIAGGYEFDRIVIWANADGKHMIGRDAGCSCPVPFEDTGLSDLTEIRTLADVVAYANKEWGCWKGDDYCRGFDQTVADLLTGLTLN